MCRRAALSECKISVTLHPKNRERERERPKRKSKTRGGEENDPNMREIPMRRMQ